MKVSVVIITKNQKDLLEKSLPILLKQKFDEDFEIIVVDSGSTDGAVEYVKSQKIKLVKIKPENFNYAFAFNTGASKAEGEILVRLSGDVIPLRRDFLAEITGPFDDNKVGAVYGRYTISGRKEYGFPKFWPEKRFPEQLVEYSVRPNILKYFFDGKYRERITNFTGGCCAVRRSIWEKRHFNENLSAAEDAEYSVYLHLLGCKIVCNPKATVLHEHKIVSERLISEIFPKWVWQLNFQVLKLFLSTQ